MKSPLILKGGLKMIEGNDQKRAQSCMQNVQIILEQYDCELHPVTTITPAGNEFGFRVFPKPRMKEN